MLYRLLKFRDESKLICGEIRSPANETPEASTATHTPTNHIAANAKASAVKSSTEDPLPFRVNFDLNKHLFLFEGDICSLRTDCLMCFTTDGFSGADELASRLLSSELCYLFLAYGVLGHTLAQLSVQLE